MSYVLCLMSYVLCLMSYVLELICGLFVISELGTLEWWKSGLMLNPLFLLISKLT